MSEDGERGEKGEAESARAASAGEAGSFPLQASELAPLVQRAAVRTAGEEVGGGVGVFAGAKAAAEDVAEGGALAALAPPFAEKPRADDRPEHEHEVDENEIAERDADHGECGIGAYASSPHSTVTVAHVIGASLASKTSFWR